MNGARERLASRTVKTTAGPSTTVAAATSAQDDRLISESSLGFLENYWALA